jgi:hypothetical protein
MPEPVALDALQRVIIIGNSGSGKSALAASIGRVLDIPIITLDTIHWEHDGYGQKRDEHIARQLLIDATAATPQWIVEGVFGWLVEAILTRATALMWLDLPVDVCRQGLLARGKSARATEPDFANLLSWCEEYGARPTSSSYTGHMRIFESFDALKIRLRSREEVSLFLRHVTGSAKSVRNERAF